MITLQLLAEEMLRDLPKVRKQGRRSDYEPRTAGHNLVSYS